VKSAVHNYTINPIFFSFFLEISLKTIALTNKEYSDFYYHNLTDPSIRGSVLTCDVEHNLNMFYVEHPLPNRFVPVPISKSYYAVGFSFPNLWNERFLEIIEGLVTGGIINHHLEKYTKSKWNFLCNQFDSRKVVLNLSHLGFGFQICFFALYAAFLTFCLELVIKWYRSRTKVDESLSRNKSRLEEFEKSLSILQILILELIIKHGTESVRSESSLFGKVVTVDIEDEN